MTEKIIIIIMMMMMNSANLSQLLLRVIWGFSMQLFCSCTGLTRKCKKIVPLLVMVTGLSGVQFVKVTGVSGVQFGL